MKQMETNTGASKPALQDHYAVLGIPATANDAQIRSAYRNLSLTSHTDKQDEKHQDSTQFQRIKAAFDVLIDPENRKVYDSMRRQGRTTQIVANFVGDQPASTDSMALVPVQSISVDQLVITSQNSEAELSAKLCRKDEATALQIWDDRSRRNKINPEWWVTFALDSNYSQLVTKICSDGNFLYSLELKTLFQLANKSEMNCALILKSAAAHYFSGHHLQQLVTKYSQAIATIIVGNSSLQAKLQAYQQALQDPDSWRDLDEAGISQRLLCMRLTISQLYETLEKLPSKVAITVWHNPRAGESGDRILSSSAWIGLAKTKPKLAKVLCTGFSAEHTVTFICSASHGFLALAKAYRTEDPKLKTIIHQYMLDCLKTYPTYFSGKELQTIYNHDDDYSDIQQDLRQTIGENKGLKSKLEAYQELRGCNTLQKFKEHFDKAELSKKETEEVLKKLPKSLIVAIWQDRPLRNNILAKGVELNTWHDLALDNEQLALCWCESTHDLTLWTADGLYYLAKDHKSVCLHILKSKFVSQLTGEHLATLMQKFKHDQDVLTLIITNPTLAVKLHAHQQLEKVTGKQTQVHVVSAQISAKLQRNIAHELGQSYQQHGDKDLAKICFKQAIEEGWVPSLQPLVKLAVDTYDTKLVEFCLAKCDDPHSDFYSPVDAVKCCEHLQAHSTWNQDKLVAYRLACYLNTGTDGVPLDQARAQSLCDTACRTKPEKLAEVIVHRITTLARDKGKEYIGTLATQDPGIQALVKEKKAPRAPGSVIPDHLYKIYKALGLLELAWQTCDEDYQSYPTPDSSVCITRALRSEETHPLDEELEGLGESKGSETTLANSTTKGTTHDLGKQQSLSLPQLSSETLASSEFQERTLTMLSYAVVNVSLYSGNLSGTQNNNNLKIIINNRVTALLQVHYSQTVLKPEGIELYKRIIEIPHIHLLLDSHIYWHLLRAVIPQQDLVTKVTQFHVIIQQANVLLGNQASQWTNLQKLYLGSWLVLANRKNLIPPSEYSFKPFCCQMLLKTLSTSMDGKLDELFAKLDEVYDFCYGAVHKPEAAALCRTMLAESASAQGATEQLFLIPPNAELATLYHRVMGLLSVGDKRDPDLITHFIRRAAVEAPTPRAAQEEKRPTGSPAPLVIQLITDVLTDPKLRQAMYVPDSQGLLPLHVAVQTGQQNVILTLLQCGVHTQIHKATNDGKTIKALTTNLSLQNLLGSQEQLADLMDLKIFVEKAQTGNPKATLLYLNILTTLTNYAQKPLLCLGLITQYLQEAYQEPRTSKQTISVTATEFNFCVIVQGLLNNLERVKPQYLQYKSNFDGDLAAIKLPQGSSIPPKTQAEYTNDLFAYFLRDKASQVLDTNVHLKLFFYVNIVLWSETQVRNSLHQLHPTIASAMYSMNLLGTKVDEAMWVRLASSDSGYFELAKLCFAQFQVQTGVNPTSQQEAKESPTTSTQSDFYATITAPDLCHLALATQQTAAVQFCLKKFNDPNDRLYSPPAVEKCYRFLIKQADVLPADSATYHYRLAWHFTWHPGSFYPSGNEINNWCDKALDLNPEVLATEIFQRMVTKHTQPNIAIKTIQEDLEQDPGYQAFIWKIQKDPTGNIVVHQQLYELCKNLGLYELACRHYEEMFKCFFWNPQDPTHQAFNSVERALLFEKANPIPPVTVWTRPLSTKDQTPVPADGKAEETEAKELSLPELATDILQSKPFQARTLTVLSYVSRVTETEPLIPRSRFDQARIIITDRIKALLRPYTADFTRPILNPDAKALCESMIPLLERPLRTTVGVWMIDWNFYHLCVLPTCYGDKWPENGAGLVKLFEKRLLDQTQMAKFTKEELAVLNEPAMVRKFLEFKNALRSFNPERAIQLAENSLGEFHSDWSQIQKLYLGVWIEDCMTGTASGMHQNVTILRKNEWTYSVAHPPSWSFGPLCRHLLQQTLTRFVKEPLPTLLEKLSATLGLFSNNVPAEVIQSSRQLLAGSASLWRDMRSHLQSMPIDQGFFDRQGNHHKDINIAYQRAVGLVTANLVGEDKLAPNPIAEFIHYEASFSQPKPVTSAPSEQKQFPLSVQLIEKVMTSSAAWSYLQANDSQDTSPLQAAVVIKSEPIVNALLRYAPYTQTHAILKGTKDQTAKSLAPANLQTLLTAHEQRADLIDMRFYLHQVFSQNRNDRQADRKALRAEAYLLILKTLAKHAAKDPVQCKAELSSIITIYINKDKTMASTGWRKLASSKPSTFVQILEGLRANLDHLVPQYLHHQVTFDSDMPLYHVGLVFLGQPSATEKTVGDAKAEVLAPFLAKKDTQTSDRATLTLFYQEIERDLWQGKELKGVLAQLHMDVLLEIFEIRNLRDKVNLSTWLELALKPGYSKLAQCCFKAVINQTHLASASSSLTPQASSALSVPAPTLITISPARAILPISPQELVKLALATQNAVTVKQCLQKLNDPQDPFYSPISAKPVDGSSPPPQIPCYEFLIKQPDIAAEDYVTNRYHLACYRANDALIAPPAREKQARQLCHEALNRMPEVLTTAILQRFLAQPQRPANVTKQDIQQELAQDPGYQELVRRVQDKPTESIIFHQQLYRLYNSVGLYELAWATYDKMFSLYFWNHLDPKNFGRNLNTHHPFNSVERALLWEKANPLPATDVWPGPLQLRGQIDSAESKVSASLPFEQEALHLPALSEQVLTSELFQKRTLTMLSYVAQVLYTETSMSTARPQQAVTIAIDRVRALLRPYHYLQQGVSPDANQLCHTILEIPGIQGVVELGLYELLLAGAYDNKWPENYTHLAKLLEKHLLDKDQTDLLGKSVLAFLNTEETAQTLIELKLKPQEAIQIAEQSLGAYGKVWAVGIVWTQQQKLCLGLWIKAYKPDSTQSLLELSPLCCWMLRQTLSDFADQPLSVVLQKIGDIVGFFRKDHKGISVELVQMFRKVAADYPHQQEVQSQWKAVQKQVGSGGSLRELSYQLALGLQDPSLWKSYRSPDALPWFLAQLLVDPLLSDLEKLKYFVKATENLALLKTEPVYLKFALLYRKVIEEGSAPKSEPKSSSPSDLKSESTDTDSDINLLKFFMRLHAVQKNQDNASPPAVGATEQKRTAEPEITGVQLIEAVMAKPAHWSCFSSPDKVGEFLLHQATSLKLEDVAASLLRIAPYTQTHAKYGDKTAKNSTSEKSLQTLLTTHEQRADLWDLKLYLDEIFGPNKGGQLGDRKLVRATTYLAIIEALETTSQDNSAAALSAIIKDAIEKEKEVASKGLRGLLGLKSTFIEILKGLNANLVNVSQQYHQHKALFQVHLEGLKPHIMKLNGGKLPTAANLEVQKLPSKVQEEKAQPRIPEPMKQPKSGTSSFGTLGEWQASWGGRGGPLNSGKYKEDSDDDVDAELITDLRKSNKGGPGEEVFRPSSTANKTSSNH